MKTLIVFYSFTHNNNLLAKHIQQQLNCDMLEILEIKKRKPISILWDLIFKRTPKIKNYMHQVGEYDQCIFISPIWAGKLATPLKAFLMKERNNIKEYSFICVCGGGNETQKEKIAAEFTKILSRKPKTVCELWTNDLLPKEKQNKVKYTSGYRINEMDLEEFSGKINSFFKTLGVSHGKIRKYTYSN